MHHEGVQNNDEHQRQEEAEEEEGSIKYLTIMDIHVGIKLSVDAEDFWFKFDQIEICERGWIADANDQPEDEYCYHGIPRGSDGHGLYGVHHSQVPVQGHEDESVDAGVSGDVKEVLVQPTEELTERPQRHEVSNPRKRDAHDDKEEICCGQIENEDVRGAAHLFVR